MHLRHFGGRVSGKGEREREQVRGFRVSFLVSFLVLGWFFLVVSCVWVLYYCIVFLFVGFYVWEIVPVVWGLWSYLSYIVNCVRLGKS